MTVARQTLFGQTILDARAQGLAVVVITNNPRYAHLIGDRFLLLAGGQVADANRPRHFIGPDAPESTFPSYVARDGDLHTDV